jgi:pimeloyl-ACP methyl ester carboxylesterase
LTRAARPRHGRFRGLGVSGFHELHYLEWGRRDSKRVIVCAHGYSGNARDFDYLARELSREARVICVDMAGRGESEWLKAPMGYHFGQFVADIHSLLAHLKVAEVQWVGTSMGGLLGMLLAAKAASPVKRLVMNDVGAFLPIDALQAIARNLEAPESFASRAELEAHLRHTHREWGQLTAEQWRHLALHGSRRGGDGRYRLHYDPEIARVVRPMPLTPGLFFWDAWYRVRCPALLLRGETSQVFPREVADAMLDVKPEAELVEFAGCGHVPALMSPEQVGVVRNFLRGVPSERHEPRQRPYPPRAA